MRKHKGWSLFAIGVVIMSLSFGTIALGQSRVQKESNDERIAALEQLVAELENRLIALENGDPIPPVPEPEATATPTEVVDPQPEATATPVMDHQPDATATPVVEPQPDATATTEPTETGEPQPTGSMDMWHAPGSHDGLPAHDHGDASPQWVLDAGYAPAYSHAANTPNENMTKHTAMKGISATMNGVGVYVVAHLDTNPNGQQGRFHSYQFWMQDPSGGVSNIHGWLDFGEGDNALPNIRPVDSCGATQSIRPIISVNFPECELTFESWYSRAGGSGGHAPDFGFNMKAQYYHGPEQGVSSSSSLDDMETWLPTGEQNDVRRMEVAWYADRSDLRGEFYTDQWGRTLSGPDDPSVGTTRTIGGRDYVVLSLRQFIAPTAVTLGFPGNASQNQYPMASPFELPN